MDYVNLDGLYENLIILRIISLRFLDELQKEIAFLLT